MNRRLPVYMMLDCSESMAGAAIDTVNTAIQAMIQDLRKNPHALETVSLSVITFSRTAQQIVPLTELERFQIPELPIHPGTSLGAALNLLIQCIDREVVKTTPEKKGDWRPLVFLFTDGQPTDDWQKASEKLRAMKSPKIANIYAIGCGDDVDYAVLHSITDIVFKTTDMNAATIQKAFIWITASVRSASLGADGGVRRCPIWTLSSEALWRKCRRGLASTIQYLFRSSSTPVASRQRNITSCGILGCQGTLYIRRKRGTLSKRLKSKKPATCPRLTRLSS